MKLQRHKVCLVATLACMLVAVPAMAQNNAFAFIYAYSPKSKEAYCTPVIAHHAKGKAFNEKEYVADIKLIRQMEDAFERYLKNSLEIDTTLFSFIARTGFRSQAVALHQLENEKASLRIQGLEMKLIPDFAYNP
jgi:hypothetical protein